MEFIRNIIAVTYTCVFLILLGGDLMKVLAYYTVFICSLMSTSTVLFRKELPIKEKVIDLIAYVPMLIFGLVYIALN